MRVHRFPKQGCSFAGGLLLSMVTDPHGSMSAENDVHAAAFVLHSLILYGFPLCVSQCPTPAVRWRRCQTPLTGSWAVCSRRTSMKAPASVATAPRASAGRRCTRSRPTSSPRSAATRPCTASADLAPRPTPAPPRASTRRRTPPPTPSAGTSCGPRRPGSATRSSP
jgi:hypothetical protein